MARGYRIAILCLAAAAAAGLLSCGPRGTRAPAADVPEPAWPPPPEAARVRYVASFSSLEDLGGTRGILQRIGTWLTGESELRLVLPMAVVPGSGGEILVADPGVQGVHRFEPSRGRHDLVRGPGGMPFPSPVGLAAGPGGEVYLADSALRQIFVIRPGEDRAAPLPRQAPLEQPTAVAVDGDGKFLYVVDTGAHRIRVLGTDGALLRTIGERGSGNGQFNYPTALWRDRRGRLFVADSLNFRIQRFGPDGSFQASFGRAGDGSGDLARPKGIAVDPDGHVWLVDSLFHAVQLFSESGEFLLSFGGQGGGRGEFWLPAGIFIDPGGTVYVADSRNRRVQVFRYIGGAS